MDWEKLVLLKVLDGDDLIRKNNFVKLYKLKVREDYFKIWRKVYEYIIEHYEKYKVVPSYDIIKTEFKDFSKQKVLEPLEFYVDKLIDLYKYRNLLKILEKVEKTIEVEDYDKGIEIVNKLLHKIKYSVSESSDIDIRDVDKRLEVYDKKRKGILEKGIPTGWQRLDEELGGGLLAGDFFVVVGRMGSFKTWILLFLAVNVWLKGYRFILFTREMSADKVARRFDSILSGIKFKYLKSGTLDDDKFNLLEERLEMLKKVDNSGIIIGTDKTGKYGLSFIQAKIEEYRPDIVFIDGMYLLYDEEGATDVWVKQMNISRGLKKIALLNNIPIVGTTQGSRGGKNKGSLENIAYTDAYGQDADIVLWLARVWDKILEDYTNEVWFRILKIREGENIRFKMILDFDTMELKEGNIDIGKDMEDEVFQDDIDEAYINI